MAVKNISGTVAVRSTIALRHVNFGAEPPIAFPIKAVKPIDGQQPGRGADADDAPKAWYRKSFVDFCNATALHGYSYIVQKDASPCERLTWVGIVILALIASVILLYTSWRWNAATPCNTIIENTHYATWNVAFPAVTICNMNKISAAAALRVAGQMQRTAATENVTDQELSHMFRLVLHFEGVGRATPAEYEQLNGVLLLNKLPVGHLMRRIAPPCGDMLERCMWKGTQTRCDNLFQDVNTTEGVCCSFNNHARAEQNFPSKLMHSIPKVPRKVTACGYQTGLTVLLKPFINDYHSTVLSSTGFKVFVHNSYDYPDDNAETKYVSSLAEAFITITPESTYSTPAIERMSLADRYCYFGNERPLHVMQSYTYINCMVECRSEVLLRACGCVPYNYPNNGSVRTCQLDSIECVHEFKRVYCAALPSWNGTAETLADTDCDCLPDCELLQYNSEITTGRLNRDFSYNSMTFFKDIILEDQSLIHVYFNDLVSTLYRKDSTQYWISSLAYFGGLLGLLLGFSFVTAFEMVYFFTIRPLLDYFMQQRKQSKVAPK